MAGRLLTVGAAVALALAIGAGSASGYGSCTGQLGGVAAVGYTPIGDPVAAGVLAGAPAQWAAGGSASRGGVISGVNDTINPATQPQFGHCGVITTGGIVTPPHPPRPPSKPPSQQDTLREAGVLVSGSPGRAIALSHRARARHSKLARLAGIPRAPTNWQACFPLALAVDKHAPAVIVTGAEPTPGAPGLAAGDGVLSGPPMQCALAAQTSTPQ